MNSAKRTIQNYLKVIRPFVKPFLVVFLIYCFAMLAVLRAGVSFTDDQKRAIVGNAWLTDFNRVSSTALGLLMNVNDRLLDISPWSQIFGLMVLSIVSVIITYVFCDRKIRYLPLILSTFIGLLPLTVECWLYKFDAPCMAFSLLVSTLPILWWPKNIKRNDMIRFGILSLICMLIMWTTYQAASGVFPVLCIFMVLRDYFGKEKILIIFKKFLLSVGVVILAALIFKYCLPDPVWSYRKTEMFGIKELIPGVLGNYFEYLKIMIGSLNIWQMILAGMSILGTIILSFYKYGIKALVFLVSFLIVLPLSIGAFLLLVDPSLTPRSLIGVGMSFVPILIFTTKDLSSLKEYIFVAPSLILLYSFLIFVLALGNGLADQERWANFRTEDLVSKLAELYPDKNEASDKIIKIMGDIGYSAVMQHVAEKYPVSRQIITGQQTGLSGEVWGLMKIRSYYGLQQEFEIGYDNKGCEVEVSNVKIDTYYYTIRDNDERICINLK